MKAQIVPFEEWLGLHPELEEGDWKPCPKCFGKGVIPKVDEPKSLGICSECLWEGFVFVPYFEIGEKKRLYEDDVKKELARLQRWRGIK